MSYTGHNIPGDGGWEAVLWVMMRPPISAVPARLDKGALAYGRQGPAPAHDRQKFKGARTYTHTYIYIYIHTYVHTYIRTYIRTYIHTICKNTREQYTRDAESGAKPAEGPNQRSRVACSEVFRRPELPVAATKRVGAPNTIARSILQ